MDTKKIYAAIAVVLVALAAAFAALGGIVLPRAEVEAPAPVETDAPATVPAGDVTVTVTPEGSTTTVVPATPVTEATTPTTTTTTATPTPPMTTQPPAATHE